MTIFFAAKEAMLTAGFFKVKLVGLGSVCSVTYDFFFCCVFFFVWGSFVWDKCVHSKKSSVMNVWLLEYSGGGNNTYDVEF